MTVIYGIDPGRTIGVSRVDTEYKLYDAMQTKDPKEALYWIHESLMSKDIIALEKFVGGGYLTKDGIYTIELVGWFRYHFQYKGYLVVERTSQQRLSGLSEAKKIAQAKAIPGPHSWDALAHAIVNAREYG